MIRDRRNTAPWKCDTHDTSKLRAVRGFTLVETMMALLILVMLTGIVAMGIPVAFKTYMNAVNGSNSNMILSTTTSELRDELGMAQEVDLDASGKVKHYLTGDGFWASIENYENNGHKYIVKYLYTYDPNAVGDTRFSLYPSSDSPYREYLVGKNGATSLDISFDASAGITFNKDKGFFEVKSLMVTDPADSDNELAKLAAYEVKNNLVSADG